ncbi:MAG: CDP-diacylglycerol--glycerol-3-phosphate 3-phosphatidyltransferase [marine bacterium B5-7]|nr:MAG: CDP-diacylglycerol--glycerol-3-phosphate 3-phosphatidyltransferase [marine bacterium B5-7]
MISQIPNFLTFARIAATPVMVLLLRDRAYESALLLFIIAGVTDGLDGYIAKRFNFISRLGAILDPIADKMLIVSAYVMLAVLGDIPFWLFLLVGFRDLMIVGGYLILETLEGDVQMQPSVVSKINTFLQITLVIAVLLDKTGWVSVGVFLPLLIGCVTVTTLLSGAHYVWYWGIREESKRAR